MFDKAVSIHEPNDIVDQGGKVAKVDDNIIFDHRARMKDLQIEIPVTRPTVRIIM